MTDINLHSILVKHSLFGDNTLKKIKWPTLIVIAIFHILALGVFLPQFFSWANLIVAFSLYVVTGVGITFGYHRLLAHKSFDAHPIVEILAVLAGALALQGSPVEWVADHRIHHKYSDTDRDKHNSKWGFWWSHMSWIFRDFRMSKLETRLRTNLSRKKLLTFFSNTYILWQIALGLVLLYFGGWSMVIWGIFFRTVFLYHATWLVNSATHKWGYRHFESGDDSRNTWWVGLLAFGEGWHNTHHAHQTSPRHGLLWWEVDVTWYLIWILSKLKLVTNLKKIPAIS